MQKIKAFMAKRWVLSIIAAGVFVCLFQFVRRAFFPEFTLQLDSIVILLIALYVFILMPTLFTAAMILSIAARLRRHKDVAQRWVARSLKPLTAGAVLAPVLVLIWIVSEMTTYTPAQVGTQHKTSGTSIAEWKPMEINGRSEWVSIRGVDSTKPVILFVAGGPGITRISLTQQYLKSLEDDYIVVNWDQPGSGRSYGVDPAVDTVQGYVDDLNSLSSQLHQRFSHSKIYLVAESWGTLVATLAAEQKPDLYAGYVGSGQMVDMAESQRQGYNKAIEIARNNNDASGVAALEKNGPPPYKKEDSSKAILYLGYLNTAMQQNTSITGPQPSVFDGILSPELSFNDEIGAFLGVSDTYARVMPDAYTIDLRERASKIQIPYYVLQGRHDLNASNQLVEEYMKKLDSPKKELIWFEHSGHSPWASESKDFVEKVRQITNS